MKTNETAANKRTEEAATADESISDLSGRDGSRQASVAHNQNGTPIGAAIWLNADELAALGVDPVQTDGVDIQVKDGDLELTPAHAEGADQ